MLVQEVAGIIAVFAAAAVMGMLEARPFGGYGLPRTAAFGARFWQGAAWGIAMITGIILLIRVFGGFSFGEVALRGSAAWNYAALWGAVFLCVGVFEEFLFRGYAQFTLATGIGFWPAATALSAAFGALHLGNRGEDKVGALSVFVIGMFFCLALRRTGNLWFAVGLHAAFDWGETFLFSVPDSGLVAPGHLLNSSFHGPAWLTGGTVGPEGSVMAFVVIGIATAIFVRVYPAAERFQ
jgi:membrane protease YdiL (CAAX protease family)